MNFEKVSNGYDRLPEKHDLVLKYKPVFLNRGGEHLVYTVDGHPNVVIKASTYKIKDSVFKIIEQGLSNSDLSLGTEAEREYSDEIKQKNNEAIALRSYFGNEHTLKERRYLMKVPITFELLQEIFTNDYFGRTLPESAKNIKEVWTHVVVQEYAPVFEDPNRVSFNYGSFVEDGPIDNPQRYQKVTDSTLDKSLVGFNMEEFVSLQDHSKNKSLSELIALSKKDEQLREQLTFFVIIAIQYAENTGQILALAGEDNVSFYKEKNVWNFMLVDALSNLPEPIFQKTKDLGQKFLDNVVLTQEDREYIKRGINFVRTINGVALSLGLTEKLNLPQIFSQINLLNIINNNL